MMATNMSAFPSVATAMQSSQLAPMYASSTIRSLPAGLNARYQSRNSGWVACKILRFHASDGTYDLDVRERASADRIAPVVQMVSTGTCVWPAGITVSYHSRSTGCWMPTEIKSFNATDATYNLGVCENVHMDRIRARSFLGVPQVTPFSSLQFSYASSMNPVMTTTAGPYPQPAMPLAPVPLQIPPSVLGASLPDAPPHMQVEEPPSIEPIVHEGAASRQIGDLVAVIVTIRSGSSFDNLFGTVPQLAGDGNRVSVYAVSSSSLPHIAGELSGNPVQDRRSTALHRNLRRLIGDIRAVQPDSVVFNWECCTGCTQEHFYNSSLVMGLVKRLLDQGHMVMFSDFSLKALIKDWKEDLLGPNPFVKTTELNSSFQLRFDPAVLSACPSAQLQKLGELASNGKAELHAMRNTIAFSVKWRKADCSAYKCEVLTVMTKLDGQPACPVPGEDCEASGHCGLAGHVLLTYPSGGRLLASAGHWVELSRLDVTEASLLQAAAAYGATYQGEVQASLSSCTSAAERQRTLQSYSCQIVQQSAPCSYSRRSSPPVQPRGAASLSASL